LLIQFALRSAAQKAASQAEPWVELALQAGAGDGAERVVVRFILEKDEAEHVSSENTSLKDRVSRLESFATLANSVAAELKARLDSNDVADV
jgi:hypothetical protein